MSCKRHLFAMVIVVLACACATGTRQASKVPPFNTVAFVTPADIPDLANVESESEFVDEYVNAGAAIGTMGGMLAGAAACGPVLYAPCMIIMSGYGLLAGTAGGAATGLFNYTGLSRTDAAYMSDVLSRIASDRNLQSELGDNVRRRLTAGSISTAADASIQVIVRLKQVRFVESERELVSTRLHGSMVVAWIGESGEQTYLTDYAAEYPATDIDDLIANDGQLLESALEQCLADLALQMGSRLIRLQAEVQARPPGDRHAAAEQN